MSFKIKSALTTTAFLAAALAAGCSTSVDEAPVSSDQPTSAVSTSASKEELEKRMKRMTGMGTATPENLTKECIMAIGKEAPQVGNMNFEDEPIEMKSIGGNPGTEGFSAGGNFKYTNSAGEWKTGAYTCQVFTEDGLITDSSAVVVAY